MSASPSARSGLAALWMLLAAIPLRADDKPVLVPAYCPAIATEDRPRTNSFFEQPRRPTLIVLGTARLAGKQEKDSVSQKVEIEVEKVLFGSTPGRKVVCLSSWGYRPDAKPQRLILALTPLLSSKEAPFEVRYTLPPGEEKAVAALSAARMDYYALSSEAVFVGKEIQASADKGRVVSVVRVLHGPASLKGKKVCVDLLEDPIRRDSEVTPMKGEHLYFVSGIDPEYRKRPFRSIANPDGPVHFVSSRLPVDLEKTVVKALGRRDDYPLIDLDDRGEKVTHREVLFRGSVSEAIDLLDSASQGAVVLGGRFLRHNKKAALEPVLEALEADLLRAERKGGFGRLHNLISLLPGLHPQTKRQDAEALVEKWLAHLAKKPPEPPAIRREPWDTYYRSEETHTDANHSLAWLLEQMDEGEVVEQYGKRLLALRDKAPGRWKQEVQLALDVAKVEDHLELAEGWALMKDVRPVRSKSGMRHPGGGGEGLVAFTPDGKHLATVDDDLRVWETKGWTLAAPAIPLGGSISRLVFSPDGKYLYVAGGGGGAEVHARFDWKAGKLDRAYKGHKSGLADLLLSADGKTMVTSNYYEDKIHVWDAETGKIRKTFETPKLACQIALSSDGGTLLRKVALESGDEEEPKTRWAVEALGPKAPKVPKNVLEDNPDLAAFSQDGKYCLVVGPTVGHGGSPQKRAVRLYDVKEKFREIGKTTIWSLPPRRITFYPEKGAVLIEGQWSDTDLHALSLPRLEPLKGFENVTKRCAKPKSACFSPDGKLLAVGVLFRPTPRLFRTDGYEELIPYDGHGRGVSEVFFPPGGKTLRTLGSDNTVCTWDARTLKMLGRISLPPDWEHESSRKPDGRYLIGSARAGEEERVLKVFDVEAGKVIASVKVPWGSLDSLSVFWLNEREVYAVTRYEACRFDVTTGKVLARRKSGFDALARSARLTTDGKDFFVVGGGIPKYPLVEVKRVSVETGKSRLVGKFHLRTFTGNSARLVPGGKYFYVGDPGFYLFDSVTLKPVTSRAFRGTSSLSLDFTSDGARFAVVTGGAIYVDRDLRKWDPQTQSVVRIHDTKTGRTLGAFPASTRGASVTFAPDGKRLVVTNDDGTFESWDLSALDRF